jgi:hypothetical protein
MEDQSSELTQLSSAHSNIILSGLDKFDREEKEIESQTYLQSRDKVNDIFNQI